MGLGILDELMDDVPGDDCESEREEIARLRALLAECPSVLLAASNPWGATHPDQRGAARFLLDLHAAGFDPPGGWTEDDLADLRASGGEPPATKKEGE